MLLQTRNIRSGARFCRSFAVGALCLALVSAAELFGANYFVATNGSDLNPGTSIAQPFLTIQKAANVASPGDTVNIRGGTYRETVTLTRSGLTNAPIVFQS